MFNKTAIIKQYTRVILFFFLEQLIEPSDLYHKTL